MNIVKRSSAVLRRFSTNSVFHAPSSSAAHSVVPRTPSPSDQGWEASEEPLEDYDATGYHPVTVGDVLGSRYRVLRKLGWGNYSTVWLVQEQSKGSFAALKLMTGLATDATELHELEYLQRMRGRNPLHPGHPHVLQLLDHFHHHGPNGRHLCLVTEPLAENLHSFSKRWKNGRSPINLVNRITRQVLLGLDYLHNECDIIHTDIKPDNILMAVADADIAGSMSDEAETSIGTSPDGHPISRVRSHPISYTLPEGDLNAYDTWKEVNVKLADVGVACWADNVEAHFTDLIQSPALRAPEVCVGAGWGKPADIWSLGCTVYELAMGKSLLARDIHDESVPYIHTLLFGDYPPDLIKRGKYSDVFFDDNGSLKIPLPQRASLEMNIRKQGALPNVEAFIDFLRLMLTLEPAKRASCQELLAHEWLNLEH